MKNLISIVVALMLLSFTVKAQTFTDQLSSSGLQRTDKIGEIKELFDYNNDGFEDIIYTTKISTAALYKNNGNGTFTDVSTTANFPVFPIAATSLSCMDLDNNGFKDVVYYLGHGGGNVNDTLRIFMNYNGSFIEKTTAFGITNPILQGTNHICTNIMPVDYDRDGDLDFLFASTKITASNACNNSKISVLVNKLENLIKPSFNTMIELISYPVNILPYGLGVTDYNNDQLADIAVCEQNGASGEFGGYRADPFVIYKNNGDATFTKVTGTNLADAALHNFITVWDYNNDGFLDFINGTSDCCGTRTNIIWRNNGNGTFTDMRATYNLHPVNNYYGRFSAVDSNNDGYFDISTTGLGGFWSDTRHQLWENNGTTFTNKASTYGLQLGYNGGFKGIGSSSEWFDYDNDGDLDFYSFNWNDGPNYLQYLMNNPNTAANKHLRIKLVGTDSPIDGTGSRVVVKIGTQKLTQYNNGKIDNNYSDIFHFGVGQNATVDSVYVYWSSGNITKMANVATNQLLAITEKLPFMPASANPALSDPNTVLLDHFDLSTSGEIAGTTNYGTAIKGLGKAVRFSSAGNYLIYAKPDNLESAGTIEMWLNLENYNIGLLDINWNKSYSSPGAGHVLHLRVDSVGKIGLSDWSWTASTGIISKSRVKLNTWTHIAVSWGDSTKIYINGKVDKVSAEQFRPAITVSQNYFYLPYWGGNVGYIDEFHVSKVQRTNAEIASRVNPLAEKTISDMTPGTLETRLTLEEKVVLRILKIAGTIDARDFKTMRDLMPLLAEVDLSGTKIAEYTGTDGTSGYINGNTAYQANTIPEFAFNSQATGAGKTTLTSIYLPSEVQLIDVSAFEECRNLQSVIFANGVRYINDYAFYNCRALKELILPGTLQEINSSAFENCRSITTLSLPDQLTTIGGSAFWGCSGLTNITFGSNVTSIGDAAFWGCYKVNSILSQSVSPPLLSGVQVFGQIDKAKCNLTVPEDGLAAYSFAPQWEDFIIKVITSSNELKNSDNKVIAWSKSGNLFLSSNVNMLSAEVYNINGQLINRLENIGQNTKIPVGTRGVYVLKVRLSDSTTKTIKIIN